MQGSTPPTIHRIVPPLRVTGHGSRVARPRLARAAWYLACCLLPILAPRQARAEWGWYSGDVCVRAARDSGFTLPERIQEAAHGGLDWVVTVYPIQAGPFRGIFEASYEPDEHPIVPILGVGGEGKGIWGEGVVFGVDPRSPVPADSLQAIIDWAESHQGVFIFSRSEGRLEALCNRWRGGAAFIGLRGGRWSGDCEVGGAWDRLLRQGRRIFILGSNDAGPLRGGTKTYVWAKGNGPVEVVQGIRRGAAYVSEQDGIRMDVRVNGSGVMGSVVPAEDFVQVRIFAAARHPISRIALVGGGRVVWEAAPESTVVEERLRLPFGEGFTYLRLVAESRAGGYRALGNPVFLKERGFEDEQEGQPPDDGDMEALYAAMSGVLEAAPALSPPNRRTFLATLLRDARTRPAAVQALQSRSDLVPDEVLSDLLEDRDREVRLGAAYALVVRGGEDLSEALLGLLLDRDAAVRSYAARMIYQSRVPLPAGSLLSFLSDRDAFVRVCLTEAVDGRSDDPNVIGRLVEMLNDPDADVAAAASNKLVEMGRRSYRTVTALLQALRAGNGRAADVIGRVGDHRILPALEDAYQKAPYGDLKRRCFLALDRMGAPYPGRRQVAVRRTPSEPVIDGVLSPGEWDGAVPLEGLGSDEDGTPSGSAFTGRLMRDDRAIYILFSRPVSRADETLRRLAGHDDPAILKEDRLEVSFGAGGEEKARRTFVVSAAGAQYEARNGEVAWNGAWRSGVGRSGKVWNAECAIPISSLGVRPGGQTRPLRFNLSWVEASSRVTWSITYGASDNPDRFGELFITE